MFLKALVNIETVANGESRNPRRLGLLSKSVGRATNRVCRRPGLPGMITTRRSFQYIEGVIHDTTPITPPIDAKLVIH